MRLYFDRSNSYQSSYPGEEENHDYAEKFLDINFLSKFTFQIYSKLKAH